jgi:hypothetical protein
MLMLFSAPLTPVVSFADALYNADETSKLQVTFLDGCLDDSGIYRVVYSGQTQNFDTVNIQAVTFDGAAIDVTNLTIGYYASVDGNPGAQASPTYPGEYIISFAYQGESVTLVYVIEKANVYGVNFDGVGVNKATNPVEVDYHSFEGFKSTSLYGLNNTDIISPTAYTITYDFGSSLNGSYSYDGTKPKPPVTTPTGDPYSVKIEFAGNEYLKPYETTLDFKVLATPIVAIASPAPYRYSGMPATQSIAYYTYGIAFGSDLNNIPVYSTNVTFSVVYHNEATGVYTSNPVNAGRYTISSITSNTLNYYYSPSIGYPNTPLEISKQTLTIMAISITIKLGETPTFIYDFSGFVNEETSSVINTSGLTIQDMPDWTVPGVYNIIPTGATSENYNLVYRVGQLTVNQINLSVQVGSSANDQKLTLTGEFKPNTSISVEKYESSSLDAARVASTLLKADKIIAKSDVETIYKFTFDRGGNASNVSYVAVLDQVKKSPLFTYKLAIVDDNGNIYTVDSYRIVDGKLTFSAYASGYIVLYRDSITTYLIISVIALIVITIVALRLASTLSYYSTKASIKEAKLREQRRQQIEQRNTRYKW